MAELGLSAQAEAAVYAQRNDLAAIEPPAELGAPQQEAVRRVVDSAYVTGFRVVMAVSAALAVLSALIAWWLVEGKGARAAR